MLPKISENKGKADPLQKAARVPIDIRTLSLVFAYRNSLRNGTDSGFLSIFDSLFKGSYSPSTTPSVFKFIII